MMNILARVALLLLAAITSIGVQATPTVTYYHNDLLGSPVVATNAAGQVIWRESYRPYGERITNAPASSSTDVWFTSRRQDADTGLVYMGARYYDPVIGRFISTDPVHFQESNVHSFNRYAYANNNPFKYADRSGRDAYVVYHPALNPSSMNPLPPHAAILLVPKNPGDFSDRTGWKTSVSDGTISATLGGQPSSEGKLKGAPNNPMDSPENSTGNVRIATPPGMSDTEWMNALIKAATSYKDDKIYFPLMIPGLDVFNSNSYVSGVISGAGGKPPKLPFEAPGYEKPLPLQ